MTVQTRYAVATVARERDNVIASIQQHDPDAVINKQQNPCLFFVDTKLTTFTIDTFTGVAHVIRTFQQPLSLRNRHHGKN